MGVLSEVGHGLESMESLAGVQAGVEVWLSCKGDQVRYLGIVTGRGVHVPAISRVVPVRELPWMVGCDAWAR